MPDEEKYRNEAGYLERLTYQSTVHLRHPQGMLGTMIPQIFGDFSHRDSVHEVITILPYGGDFLKVCAPITGRINFTAAPNAYSEAETVDPGLA
jgi:hypothetical protein